MRLAKVVLAELEHYLGPNAARSAVKTLSQRALHKPPEKLTDADAGQLLEALRPMLRTLLGAERCEEVLANIRQQLEP